MLRRDVDRLPDGTTLIATILNFGNGNIQQPILTYDSTASW